MVKPKLEGRKLKRLFYDLELSPNVVLSFSIGFDVRIPHENIIQERKIIMISYKWAGDKRTHLLTWDKNQDDKEMLRDFCLLLAEADEAVAFNGNRFDSRHIRTRCLIHGLPPPQLEKLVDPYTWVRRHYSFNCGKLDYVAKILGHGGKDKMSMEDWRQITLFNDTTALLKMGKYCIKDTDKLELVFNDLAPYMKPKTHVGVLGGREPWSCPRCGGTNVKRDKVRVSASGTITHQMRCQDDKTYFTISNTAYKQFPAAKK